MTKKTIGTALLWGGPVVAVLVAFIVAATGFGDIVQRAPTLAEQHAAERRHLIELLALGGGAVITAVGFWLRR